MFSQEPPIDSCLQTLDTSKHSSISIIEKGTGKRGNRDKRVIGTRAGGQAPERGKRFPARDATSGVGALISSLRVDRSVLHRCVENDVRMLTLLFFDVGWYYVEIPMKSAKIMTSQLYRRLLINLLLVGLLFSSVPSHHRKIQARQIKETPNPTSIHPANTVLRNPALTSSPGQRLASDLSKQSRGKHSVLYGGLAAATVDAPAALVRQRLVTIDWSVMYLSFRLSRPGGRAPPAAA